MIRVTDKGVRFVAHWEGFRSCPYIDAVGVWTRGYGETKGIGPGSDCISEERARDDLRHRLSLDFLSAVPRRWLMKPHERDALASLAYNLGTGVVADPQVSTLAKRLRRREALTRKGRRRIYRDEIPKWVYAGGRKLEGLVKRRAAELDLAVNADYSGRP